MIADSLNNCGSSTVADSKPFAGHSRDVDLTGSCSVKGDITDNDVVFRDEGRLRRRIDDKPTA